MILVPIVALVLGAALALMLKLPSVGGIQGQYLAVASLAGLDTICGGIRSGLEGKFQNSVFITGFISNVLIASFLAWLGEKIFLDLFVAIAFVLGARIFNNLSLIRRFLLTRWQDWAERRRLEVAAQTATRTEVKG